MALLLLPLPLTKDGSKWGFSGVEAQAANVASMDRVQIERVGGFAGFGLPDSHLKSKGDVSVSDLSAADRKRLDDLFENKGQVPQSKPDAFRYIITRQTSSGEQKIEVPEDLVPAKLRNSVKDTLE